MSGTLDLNYVRTFVTVVQQGTFSAAARAMKLPTSNVSRHVALLESHLKTRLLERSTRHLRVTDAGQRLYERAEVMLAGIDDVEAELTADEGPLRGRVRLSVPSDFGPRVLGSAIVEFCAAHPQLELECQARSSAPNVVVDGLDLAIVFQRGLPEDRAVVTKKLASLRSCVVASPALLRRVGTPKEIAELKRLPCIASSSALEGQPWHFVDPSGHSVRVPVKPRHRVDSGEMAKLAAVAGIGFAILARTACRRELEDKTLLEVTFEVAPAKLEVVALYPSRRHPPRSVRVLLARIAEQLRTLE